MSTVKKWFETIQSIGISPIQLLFNRLDGIYPERWAKGFKDDQAIRNWQEAWVEAFVEDGISQEMIKRGLANCREMYEYPPSLPQFLKACREPSKHESRHQDSKPQLTHEYTPCTTEEAAVHIANIRALIEKNGGILKNVTEELSNGTH